MKQIEALLPWFYARSSSCFLFLQGFPKHPPTSLPRAVDGRVPWRVQSFARGFVGPKPGSPGSWPTLKPCALDCKAVIFLILDKVFCYSCYGCFYYWYLLYQDENEYINYCWNSSSIIIIIIIRCMTIVTVI